VKNGETVRVFFFLIFLLFALLVLAAKSLVKTKEDELLVVFRLGKVLDVYGPGLSIVLPFLDRVIRVNVETIDGWENLSESELKQRAAQSVGEIS
jgi:regulator of protease activity HflC (stomatin/prohibitin superfamily)